MRMTVSTLAAVTAITALLLRPLSDEADAGARRSRPLRTGQATCWDTNANVVGCAGTGQDGELQRGEPRAYIDNGNGTIKDNRTALTWEKLSDDGTVHDNDNLYLWPDAFVDKIATLNTPPCFAGFCDWRLPNIMELQTLGNFGTSSPTVSAPFNTGCSSGCTVLTCSCTAANFYWSSSDYGFNPKHAWAMSFGDGQEVAQIKYAPFRVRAVRGGS